MVTILSIAGLVLLVAGAEFLVKGASRLASSFGISPLVIGLTVVAFGTSAPEMAVSVKSTLAGQGGIALGNVIGSNIFNVLAILGLTAMIAPLVVSQQLVRFDVPLMVALSVLVYIFGYDGRFGWIEGAVLAGGLACYTVFLIRQSRKESAAIQEEYAGEFGSKAEGRFGWVKNAGLAVVGLGLLVLGSQWFVSGAIAIAQHFGVSEEMIGLTIVAAGTSLPEVVTSVIASIRGKVDIAVGNVVGSNLFNLMGVLGVASITAPGGIEVSDAVLRFDLPIMVAVAFACLPIFFTGFRIGRTEGALFFGYYVAYTVYLFFSSTEHDVLPVFSWAMLYFVIPLTVVTLAVVAFREWRGRKA